MPILYKITIYDDETGKTYLNQTKPSYELLQETMGAFERSDKYEELQIDELKQAEEQFKETECPYDQIAHED